MIDLCLKEAFRCSSGEESEQEAMADKRKLQGEIVIFHRHEMPTLTRTPNFSLSDCLLSSPIFVTILLRAGDIDRCLKKVTEGVDQFEDIWKKVFSISFVPRLCFHHLLCIVRCTQHLMPTRKRSMRLI